MNNRVAFIDIDTQQDFMSPNGRLYVSGAEGLIPNLKRLFMFAKENDIPIISSLDTHKKDDPEFKDFPPHCIKGTSGYKKIKVTLLKKGKSFRRNIGSGYKKEAKLRGQIFIIKNTFDIFSNPKTKALLAPYDSVYVFGVALDYCVKAACLGAAKLGIKTHLVMDATKAVSTKGKIKTLRLLKHKGVVFTRTEQVTKKLKRVIVSQINYD